MPPAAQRRAHAPISCLCVAHASACCGELQFAVSVCQFNAASSMRPPVSISRPNGKASPSILPNLASNFQSKKSSITSAAGRVAPRRQTCSKQLDVGSRHAATGLLCQNRYALFGMRCLRNGLWAQRFAHVAFPQADKQHLQNGDGRNREKHAGNAADLLARQHAEQHQ